MARRTDVHSLAKLDPADYDYIGSFDNWPEVGAFVSQTTDDYDTDFGPVNALNWQHAEYKAARQLYEREGVKIHFGEGRSQCDHCGALARYISLFRHKPTGEVVAVGGTCASERFSCDSRYTLDIKRLKKRAADAAERARAFGKANDFIQAQAPELADWLLSPEAEKVHPIFADLARKLIRFGSLSEKQVAFARRLLQEHFERLRNGGKSDRELAFEAEKAKAEDCPRGRVVVTGVVLKTEVRDTQFGVQLKFAVKDDRGFVVWSSIPSALQLIQCEGFQRGLEKGERVTFTATLEPSEKDPKFGFGSRPSKASLVVEQPVSA